jgi:hypothetical protein
MFFRLMSGILANCYYEFTLNKQAKDFWTIMIKSLELKGIS